MNTFIKGKKGEEQAAGFLTADGYTIIMQNFRHRRGEIDIIAEKAETLVFVEVKTWDACSAIDIEYAVNVHKIKKIITTARYFLMGKHVYENRLLRFDLIFISGNFSEITHIKNAFSEV